MSASAIRREAIIRCYYYTGLVFPSLHGLFTRATLDSAFISCRRVSVCLSVTSRCSTEMAKRIGSHNTTRWPRDSSFLMPKISSKLKQGHPQRRRQMYRWGRLMRVRQLKIGDFRREALLTQLGRKFITLSVHLTCLQHVRRYAARRAGLSATTDPCIRSGHWFGFFVLACVDTD